jgi:hypothetical protein
MGEVPDSGGARSAEGVFLDTAAGLSFPVLSAQGANVSAQTSRISPASTATSDRGRRGTHA